VFPFSRAALWTLVDSGVRAEGFASLKEKSILVIARYKSKDSF